MNFIQERELEMKVILLVAIGVVVSGTALCFMAPKPEAVVPRTEKPRLVRVEDERVLCYMITGQPGISCWPKSVD